MQNDWITAYYDATAETYDRLAAPHVFTRPAQDLVALLKVPAGARALDVGAGTGAATLLASEAAGPRSLVVGLDASLAMLRLARHKGLRPLVGGVVPGLPFAAASFDGVLANFAVSHFPSYGEALSDMVRVLRPGGRLAATAWGLAQNEWRALWQAVAQSFVRAEELERGFRQAVPWEAWFSEPGRLQAAWREAGLEAIEVHHREYRVSLTAADFLAMREATVQARLLQQSLSAAEWQCFRETVAAEFHGRCRGLLDDTRDVHLIVGVKP